MRTMLQDLRYGLRMLAKNPGFTAVAVLTLALGIGANLTIFSWIRGTLLDPVPGVTHTSDLVSVTRGERSEHPTPPFSYPDYADLRREAHSLSGLVAYHHDWVALTGLSKPERVYGETVSANYFDVLGVKPLLGRVFNVGEEEKRGSTPPVVISYAFWQSHFGGDPAIIGKSIQLDRMLCVIVGVVPPGFQACGTGVRMDLWAPLVYGNDNFSDRGDYWLNVLGRLAPGISRRQSEQELNLLMQRLVAQYPDSHRGPNQITLDPLWRSPFSANVYLAESLPMLLGLAGVLLLLACANVANLLLVRGVARRREIALRLSMGASRWRLVRQFLLESLLLSLAASAVAMLVTSWTAGTFAAFFPPIDLPLAINGRVDFSVFLVALLVFSNHCHGFRRAARAANLPARPGVSPEGRGPQRVGRTAQVAPRDPSRRDADLIIPSPADLCRIVYAQHGEGSAFGPGLRPEPRDARVFPTGTGRILGQKRN